ncbi:uncharacterized protein [Eurosta solidaginis]|uniref:uncharacterized protein n=1 Tax=Eurosta solidaginis TaxID=178769 RepID=UPI003530E280
MWSATDLMQKSKMQLSRTSLLVQDYLQFKAARTIQKYFRRWYYRRIYLRKLNAAILIQYEWRKFYRRHMTYQRLEEQVQEEALKFYNIQATKIQALWRGWFTRQNIHDHDQLLKTQIVTAEDLLQCVAFKLHHMLRTYHIPGVYSLKNSHCLSKVEKLLAAMSFKQHNKHVRQLRAHLDCRTRNARKKFEDSAFTTSIPYAGPDIKGLCDTKCAEFLKSTKDIDRRMFQILNTYEEAAKAEVLKKRRLKHKPRYSKELNRRNSPPKSVSKRRGSQAEENKPDFCEDIVNSMKRWSILRDNHVTVDPEIFRRPEMLENFLREIDSIYNMMQDRCHCRIKTFQDLCH